MHQLGYELPERSGFAGLWEAVAEAAEGSQITAGDVEFQPEVIACCDGATSPRARAMIAAFCRTCCDVDARVAA